MDPNENLRMQRLIAQRILRAKETPDPIDAEILAELVIQLDRWIAAGGYVPLAWVKN